MSKTIKMTAKPPPGKTTPAMASAAAEPPPVPSRQAVPAVAAPLALRLQHREFFEVARAHLIKTHGKCPPTDDLMRLWLAVATPWTIIREFEEAVLNLSGVGNDLAPQQDMYYNTGVLNL
jgi:hypothetical protein